MEPRISFITLGVRDLEFSTAYYREVLGLIARTTLPTVTFFEMGRTWLALYPRDLLAEDADVPVEGSGFAGFTLAHNVRSPEEVDQLLAVAANGGGRLVKAGHNTDWGGYSGYFADPDGFLWEVAWNPDFHTFSRRAGQDSPCRREYPSNSPPSSPRTVYFRRGRG